MSNPRHDLNNQTTYIKKDYRKKDNRFATFLGFTLKKLLKGISFFIWGCKKPWVWDSSFSLTLLEAKKLCKQFHLGFLGFVQFYRDWRSSFRVLNTQKRVSVVSRSVLLSLGWIPTVSWTLGSFLGPLG
jgi:hypothetical protein